MASHGTTAATFPDSPAAVASVVVDEGFDNVGALTDEGWLVLNRSAPHGLLTWGQGYANFFDPSSWDGSPTSYILIGNCDTDCDGNPATSDAWLVTPIVPFYPGATLTFHSVSGGSAPDRLEVRLCANTDCTDVGQGPDDVGEFEDLLFSINPDLEPGVYPTTWTEFTVTGLPTSGSGRLAFRYYVTDVGTNGSIVGIDRVTIDDGNMGASGPTVTPAFSPASVGLSESSTLSFTFTNGGLADATTTQEFDHGLPAGVSVASGALPQTDCGNGSVVMSPSGRTLELAAGAVIPAGSSCSASVAVASATQGTYEAPLYPGILQTDVGQNDNFATATLVVLGPGGGPNGVIESPAPIHIIPETVTGTSVNLVAATFDDTGPLTGDWDLNFWNSVQGLDIWPIATYDDEIAVSGFALAPLQPGDVVGPATLFSDNTYHDSSELFNGGDYYIGFVFHCDGRLSNPVPGGVCYGYVHVTTTFNENEGFGAFPADIVNWAFDGDGNPITIAAGGGEGHDPAISVTPAAPAVTVAADQVATQTLTISNGANSNPLAFNITRNYQGQGGSVPLQRKTNASSPMLAIAAKGHPATSAGPRVQGRGERINNGRASTPWAPQGSLLFQLDDGGYEDAISISSGSGSSEVEFPAVWINRFAIPDGVGAFTVDSVSVEWPTPQALQGSPIGLQANIVAYYDADGDGDPTNAVRLGADTLVTIGSTGAFETYPVNFEVPGPGDVYIGFVDQWANTGQGYSPAVHPAALDVADALGNPHSAQSSYVSYSPGTVDVDDLGNNQQTFVIDETGYTGNFMVRATGSGGADAGPCSGPLAWWVAETPTSGTLGAGQSEDITVTITPAATGLRPGDYTAQICMTTNDPAHPVVNIPIAVTVTPGAPPCPADRILSNGFDDDTAGCGSSAAAVTYTDKATFLAQVATDYFENTFDDVDLGPSADLDYTSGDFAYTVAASHPFDPNTGIGGLYNGDGFISTSSSGDQIIVTFTSGNVTAVGGSFWASDTNALPTNTLATVTLANGTTVSIPMSTPDDFVGFIAPSPIASISVDAPFPTDPTDSHWATMDDLIVGEAASP
jgi:hypothetical protein